MAKTIQAALAPLLITGAFCSLCVFEYPLGRSRPYITCLYFLIAWSIYIYIYIYILINVEGPRIIHMSTIIITISSFASMIISLFRFKELKMYLRELSIVDDTLEVLGTPKEYRRLYKWMIGVIIIWIVLSNFLNIFDVLTEDADNDFEEMFVYLILMQNVVPHVGTINGVICGTILGYMSSRFERVNTHIRNLLENNVEYFGARNTFNLFVQRSVVVETEEWSRRMWIIMHVHLQLSMLSRKLNKVFSVQLTLEMASLFVILLEQFMDFYYIYTDEDVDTSYKVISNLSIYLWAIVFTTKLLALNHICQTVRDKANETIAILYKLSNNSISEDLQEQVLQFILQIKQREVKFSGMGLFYLGNNFVREFFASMLTVCVLIIQMKDEPMEDTYNDTISYMDDEDYTLIDLY